MVKPCPVTARKAPMSATAAYTTEFTKRVAGFVMEEKNVAFNVWRRSSSSVSYTHLTLPTKA